MDATGKSNLIVKNHGDFSDGEKFYMDQLNSTQTQFKQRQSGARDRGRATYNRYKAEHQTP